MDEKVLAVKRKDLFGAQDEKKFDGFLPEGKFTLNEETMKKAVFIYRKVAKEGQLKPAEEDEEYKQIIAYLILTHKGKVFCYKRTEKAGEKRLHSNYSIGVGGHINPIDLEKKSDLIKKSMEREFEEEVLYTGEKKSRILGYINDDSNSVGRVHLGLVYEMELANENVKLNEKELDEGNLLTLAEIREKYEQLENWSKITFDYLEKNWKN
ncbi:NUDIX domain protein [uncultured archaeon]|nr:NUDIX domain protein [uncultured archaeon]